MTFFQPRLRLITDMRLILKESYYNIFFLYTFFLSYFFLSHLSSGKRIHLAHSPGPLRKRDFYPIIFYLKKKTEKLKNIYILAHSIKTLKQKIYLPKNRNFLE